MSETTYTLNIDMTNLRKSVSETVNSFRDIESSAQRAGKSIDKAFMLDMSEQISEQKEYIRGLGKEVKVLEKQYEQMADGDSRRKMLKEINDLTEGIDAEKETLRQLILEKQKYKDSTTATRTQITSLRNEMVNMKEGTTEYADAMQQLGEMQQRYNEVQRQGRVYADQFKYFNLTREAVQGLTGALSAGVGVASLFGAKSEDLVKVQARLQAVMAIAIGTQQMAKVLNKDSYTMHLLLAKAKTVDTVATSGLSKGLVAMGISATAANVAARALMITLTGGLGLAIWAAVAAFNRLNKAKEENKKKAEEARKANEDFNNAVASSASKSLVSFYSLQMQYARIGDTAEAKRKFLSDYRKELDETGLAIQNINDLEKFFSTTGTKNYIASIKARAEAEAHKSALVAASVRKLTAQMREEAAKNMIHDYESIDSSGVFGKQIRKKLEGYRKELDEARRESQQAEADIQRLGNSFINAEKNAAEAIRNTGLSPNSTETNVDVKIDDTYKKLLQQAEEQALRNHRQMELEKSKGTKEELDKRYHFALEDIERQEKAYIEAAKKAGHKDVELPDVFKKLRQQAAENNQIALDFFDLNQSQKNLQDFEKLANEYLAKHRELEQLKETAADPDKLKASGLNTEEITAIIAQRDAELKNIEATLLASNEQLQDFIGEIIELGIKEAADKLAELQAELKVLEQGSDSDKTKIPELQAKIKLLDQQLKTAQREAQAARKETGAASSFERWQKTFVALTKVEKGLNDVANQFTNVSEKAQQAIKTAMTFVSSSLQMVNGIATLADMSIKAVQGTAIGAAGAIRAVETASVILAVIGAALQITMAIVNLVKSNKAEKAAKERERIQAQIDGLKRSYDVLQKSIEKAYSTDASKLIGQQHELLKQQQQQLQLLIAQEEKRARDSNKKKDRDEAAKNAEEYRRQYNEIFGQLDDLADKAIDVMFGSDLKSAIDKFADYYIESFGKSNEEIKQNQKQFVRDMVRQMIMEIIKSGVSDKMQELRKYMSDVVAKGLVPDELYIENAIAQMTAETDAQMEKWKKWLQDDPNASREAEAKGIARASQESVDENNALLTTQVMLTRNLVDISDFIKNLVAGIANDIQGAFQIIKEIKVDTGQIKNALYEIRDEGIKLKMQ